MLYFAQQVPLIPVARTMQLADVTEARRLAQPRPSWTAVFMKAYAIVCQREPLLRQAYIRWPWPHLYEHPCTICAIPVEREHRGERILLATQIRGPDGQRLAQLERHLEKYKTTAVENIGYFRMALRLGRMPRPVRRFLWWRTLHVSGFKRAKRLGTFSISSYGQLGAEQIRPIGPLTTLLTFGPIAPTGEVVVKIVYDHRVLDGGNVARYLAALEQSLSGEILSELRAMADPPARVEDGERTPREPYVRLQPDHSLRPHLGQA
jgi:hypothetical protein